MGGHRGARAALVLRGLGGAQGERVGEGHLGRDVPGERVVGGGLVGDEVEPLAGRRPGGLDLGGIADERDRGRVTIAGRRPRPRERLRRIVGEQVDVADLEAAARPGLVDLDGQADALVHRDRERLGAAHPTEAGREGHRPAQRPVEVLAGRLGEGLVGALQDALGPDVDPRPRGHLAVHREPLSLELAEVLPGRPFPDEVRVGDQDAWRPLVRPQHPDGLAALDQEGLVVGEDPQLADDRIEGVPAANRPPGAAVHDEVIRVLGDVRVEVVHQHPQGRLLGPPATGQLGAARRTDGTGTGSWHGRQATPSGRRRRARRIAARPGGRSRRCGHGLRPDGRGREGRRPGTSPDRPASSWCDHADRRSGRTQHWRRRRSRNGPDRRPGLLAHALVERLAPVAEPVLVERARPESGDRHDGVVARRRRIDGHGDRLEAGLGVDGGRDVGGRLGVRSQRDARRASPGSRSSRLGRRMTAPAAVGGGGGGDGNAVRRRR